MANAGSESAWPTVLLSGLLALVFAGLFDDYGRVVAGMATGATLGYLLIHLVRLRRRAAELDSRLEALESSAIERPRVEARTSIVPPETVAPSEPISPRAAPQATAPSPRVVSAIPARAATAAVPPAPRQDPPLVMTPVEPSFVERGIERGLAWLRAGNPLAKVGIVVLFFGAAFLAKYAAEHAMLPLELRLAAIGAGAFGLLVTGWRLRGSRGVYAQILQGGGVAGLYLTIFAAARLYQLLPYGFALGLLVVIALASALLAVAQNALPLAVIGFAGGFLAPVMLSTGGGNHVALFTYYAVLNLGVFAVAWFRAWRSLNLIGFLFTFSITGAWRALSYRPEQIDSAVFFLLMYFVMYVAVSILFALRQKPDLRGYVSASLVFGLPVVVFSLLGSLLSRIEYGMAWSALGFGVFYLVLAWALFLAQRDSLRLLAEAFAALGVIFASLAIPLAFDSQVSAAMWSVEGAGLLWLGVRQDRRLARAFGVLLQVLAGLQYVSSLSWLHDAPVGLNSLSIGALLLAVSGVLSGRWLFAHGEKRASYETGFDAVALLWGLGWWLHGGLGEIARALPGQDYGASLAFAALSAMGLYGLGRRWNWPLPGRLALVLAALVGVVGMLHVLLHQQPSAEAGWAGWLVWFAVMYGLLWQNERGEDEASASWSRALHAATFCLLAYLLACESSWQLAQSVAGVWFRLPWGLVPALLLILASRATPWPAWPLQRQARAYRVLGSLPLAAFAVLWIVAINFSGSGDPGEIPYIALFNPIDLAVAFVLASLGLYATALSAEERSAVWRLREPLTHTHFLAVMSVLIFLWLNSALVRALHHVLGTPLTVDGVLHSVTVLASLSIFWSLLGLSALTLAARRGWRAVWIVGAALLGVVVLKLFVLDLDGRGTLARIVSFMSVGGVLLLAGYLSPLPPARADTEEVRA